MHNRWTSALLLGALFVAGCSSDDNAPSVNQPSIANRTVTLETSAADLPSGVTTFRFSGSNALGQKVFGPFTEARTNNLTLNLPADLSTLQVEGLSAPSGDLLADYVTSLSYGQTVLNNPPFVRVGDDRRETIVVLGCNRLDYGDQQRTLSSANSAQLVADLQEIPQRFNPRPSYIFFTGDLVMGENHANLLTQQLTDWTVLWNSIANGIPLAPMTGNHEMLYYDESIKDEVPDPPCGAVWSSIMAPYIPASDGPTQAAPNLDNVQRDESKLSYTFRLGSSYFICLNTETWEGGLTPADVGLVPMNWLQQKLQAAEADPTVSDILVFGHKPVFVLGNLSDEDGLNPTQALPFYNMLNASPKVRVYLCAHAHLWLYGVPNDAPAGSKLPQLVAGNAGSSIEKSFAPGYYGYTLIHRHSSGRITGESWGRPIPKPYYDQGPQPPSTIRERFTIYQGGS